MTKTLKKQLAVICVASAVAWGLGVGARELQAHNDSPKSAAEAAILFGRLLAANDPAAKESNNSDVFLSYRILSKSDREKLGPEANSFLLQALQIASKRVSFDTTGEVKKNGVTIVEIAPASKPVSLPVVVVEEQSGYRVDLLATYAKRMNLSEAEGALQSDIFNKTGIALEGLPGIDTPYIQNRICQTNLKQIGLALSQYMQDYDEVLPPAKQWEEATIPYLRNEKVFDCPATNSKKGGYAFNSNVSMKSYAHSEVTVKNKAEGIKNRHLTISVYERDSSRQNAFGTGGDVKFRHKNYDASALGTNLLFVDGHVEFFPSTTKFDFALNPLQKAPMK